MNDGWGRMGEIQKGAFGMMKIEEETYYRLVELEAGLGVSAWTWRRWIKDGKVEACLLGKGYQIRGSEINRLLSQGKRKREKKHGNAKNND